MVKWCMPASRNQWSRGNCWIVIPSYFYLNPVPIVVKVLTWTNLTRTERFQNSLCTACLSPCKDRHPTHITRVPIGTRHISYCKVSLNSNVMPYFFCCKRMDERHLSIMFGVDWKIQAAIGCGSSVWVLIYKFKFSWMTFMCTKAWDAHYGYL